MTRTVTLNIQQSRRQAVVTKRTESGYSARAQAGSVRVSIDFSKDREGKHEVALRKLIDKYEWHGNWVGSWIDNNTMAWVNTESVNCTCQGCVGRVD